MSTANIADIVRRYYRAYETKDRSVVEALLSDDFTFTSPLDERIDRATYFAKCWPNSENIRAFTIETLFERGAEIAVRYKLEMLNGARFRNVELFRFAGSQIAEVDVYFGRTIEEPTRQ
jgi:ketosteroid isomerase-like protein